MRLQTLTCTSARQCSMRASLRGARDTNSYLRCSYLETRRQPALDPRGYLFVIRQSMDPQQAAQECSSLVCHAFPMAADSCFRSVFRFLNPWLERKAANPSSELHYQHWVSKHKVCQFLGETRLQFNTVHYGCAQCRQSHFCKRFVRGLHCRC
jgi:hypothetical protein